MVAEEGGSIHPDRSQLSPTIGRLPAGSGIGSRCFGDGLLSEPPIFPRHPVYLGGARAFWGLIVLVLFVKAWFGACFITG